VVISLRSREDCVGGDCVGGDCVGGVFVGGDCVGGVFVSLIAVYLFVGY